LNHFKLRFLISSFECEIKPKNKLKTKSRDPKKELLLGAGLDILHQESYKQWQEDYSLLER